MLDEIMLRTEREAEKKASGIRSGGDPYYMRGDIQQEPETAYVTERNK